MLSGDPNTAPSQGHWFPWELSAGINRVRHTALLHKACPVPPTPSQDSSVAKRHIKRASQSPRGTDSLTCARAHARVCVCMCVCVCVCRLPSWLSGKESACHAGRPGFDFWVGNIPWRREWQPTPVFLTGKSHGQRSLAGHSPWNPKELDTTE